MICSCFTLSSTRDFRYRVLIGYLRHVARAGNYLVIELSRAESALYYDILDHFLHCSPFLVTFLHSIQIAFCFPLLSVLTLHTQASPRVLQLGKDTFIRNKTKLTVLFSLYFIV